MITQWRCFFIALFVFQLIVMTWRLTACGLGCVKWDRCGKVCKDDTARTFVNSLQLERAWIIIIIIIIIILMSLMPVSSSNKDIRASLPCDHVIWRNEANGICMEERSVHCKCIGRNPRRQCAGY